MNIENLAELLQPNLDENTKILKYSTYSLVSPGENYGSEILAVDVIVKKDEKTEEVKHFVAKLKPLNESFGIMFNIQFTFKREMDLYINIIPTLIAFEKEFHVDVNSIRNCFPKCYGARLNLKPNKSDILDENGLILLENLKIQGYDMDNRMIGFDLEHTSLIIENLARFHAVPIALKLLKPDLHQQKIATLKPYNFGDSYTVEMKNQFLNQLYEIISKIVEFKSYADKIVGLVDKNFKFEERFLEPKGQYSTIVHHDLWVNNIMTLRNNNGQPTKIKIYDLQMASYGSLAHDLIFFLFTSVQLDTFINHYDNLLKLYYESFINTLKEFNLNTESFSWESFVVELNEIGPHQISHILIMQRPIFMEKHKIQNMVDVKQTDLAELHFLNKGFIIKLREILSAFIRHKWL